MAKESEKLDIDDIKDPSVGLDGGGEGPDVDLEEAVAEEPEIVEAPVESKPELPKEEKDELEKAVAEQQSEEPKEEKEKTGKRKKSFPWKTLAIIVITFLVTTALILGGLFLYEKYISKSATTVQPSSGSVKSSNTSSSGTTSPKSVYITSSDGLNLRQTASFTATALTVVPYGTQLTVLATQGGWYQVEYNNQTGWISAAYTDSENPLLYQDQNYRFQITFQQGWSGYKLFPITVASGTTASWYVALPTTVTNYTESGVSQGYASMFSLTIYTLSQWSAVQAASGPKPTLATQDSNYVAAYSLPNGTPPQDLATQAAEATSVASAITFY